MRWVCKESYERIFPKLSCILCIGTLHIPRVFNGRLCVDSGCSNSIYALWCELSFLICNYRYATADKVSYSTETPVSGSVFEWRICEFQEDSLFTSPFFCDCCSNYGTYNTNK